MNTKFLRSWKNRSRLSRQQAMAQTPTAATRAEINSASLNHAYRVNGGCVYRKPKPAHNGDEGRQGPRVVSNFAHPRAVTARLDRSEPHAEHCTSARGLHHFSGACSTSAHSPEPLFRSMIRPRTRSIAGE